MKEVATMPLRSSQNVGGLLAYSELVSQPLPGPAVVIDVRHAKSYDPPLVQYLTTEVEDLTTQMRLHQVARWRYLSKCMEFITLDSLPLDKTVDMATQFTVTRGSEEKTFLTRDDLITYLHREYVDLVRTNRISAARDTNKSIKGFSTTEVELEQSTVRVFFLADMAEPSSLTSAARYATLLRQKSHEYNNHLRLGHEERIRTIAICVNTDHIRLHQPESQYDQSDNAISPSIAVLQGLTAPVPTVHNPKRQEAISITQISSAFDMIIPIYGYRDDEGFVENGTQFYELELILYTLLLSPESLAMKSQEMSDERADRYLAPGDPDEGQTPFVLSELCLLGVASIEYSTCWARRWLNYGLVQTILQTIRNAEAIVDESDLRLPDGRDWLDKWWTEVRAVIPRTLVDAIPGFKGLPEFQRRITVSPFQDVALPDSQQALEGFCQELESYYVDTQSVTLQQALLSTEHVLSLLKETSRKARRDRVEQTPVDEQQLKALRELQRQANLFPISLFQGSSGALPRAINQVLELGSRIEGGEIGRCARELPNLSQQQEHFEDLVIGTQYQMASLLRTWQLPLFGKVLRSTLLSLFVVAFIALCCWLLQDGLTFLPPVLTLSLLGHGGISLFRAMIIVVLGLAEFFYLSSRNRRLLERRNNIIQPLCQTASAHLTEVQTAIAAKVAIMLLQDAGLYRTEGKAAQYRQRLGVLDNMLREAQEHASLHQRDAYERIKLSSNQTQPEGSGNRIWLNLSSRKDLLSWDQTIETFQRLGEKFTEKNRHLDMLMESLLRQLAAEKQATMPADLQNRSFRTAQEQFQSISSELVAMLLVVGVIGSSIVMLHPLLERYLSLESRDQYAPSLFGESIAELYNALKAMKLEQAMSSSTDSLLQKESLERAVIKPEWTIEQILVAWVENLRSTDEQSSDLLNYGNIIERLREFQIKISGILEDLPRRCRLLGYRDEFVNGNDSYVLLVPGNDSHELYEALAPLQPTQTRLLPFPDQEKLIYLHLYRIRPRS